MKIYFLIAFLLIGFSESCLAVDAYKDFKFGMTAEEVKAKNPCTLTSSPLKPSERVKDLSCDDLPFNGGKAPASFYFINNKLQRVAIAAGKSVEEFFATMQAVAKKYGKAENINSDTLRQAQLFEDQLVDHFDYLFDGGTVIVLQAWVNKIRAVLVIYTTKSFDAESVIDVDGINKTSKSMEGDL